MGGNKDVWSVAGDDSLAVGILRPGKKIEVLQEEMRQLQSLADQGLPVVDIKGMIKVGDQPAIVMERYAQGSKEIVKLTEGTIK